MPKRKSLILFTLVIAMVALFAATQVMAQQLPLTCSDGTFTMTPAPGDFPRFDDDGDECGIPGWVWDYIVSAGSKKDMSAITKIFYYAPSQAPDNVGVINTPKVHVYERGEGALNTTYGQGIYNGITWDSTEFSGASDYQITISFCTQTQTKGIISAAFVGARFIRGCEASVEDDLGPVGGIVGPSVAPVLPSRDESLQTFTATEGEMTCTVTIDESGAEPIVTVTGGCTPPENNNNSFVKLLKEIQLDGKSLVTFPFNVWVKAHGSPGTFTYCYPSGYCVVFNF